VSNPTNDVRLHVAVRVYVAIVRAVVSSMIRNTLDRDERANAYVSLMRVKHSLTAHGQHSAVAMGVMVDLVHHTFAFDPHAHNIAETVSDTKAIVAYLAGTLPEMIDNAINKVQVLIGEYFKPSDHVYKLHSVISKELYWSADCLHSMRLEFPRRYCSSTGTA